MSTTDQNSRLHRMNGKRRTIPSHTRRRAKIDCRLLSELTQIMTHARTSCCDAQSATGLFVSYRINRTKLQQYLYSIVFCSSRPIFRRHGGTVLLLLFLSSPCGCVLFFRDSRTPFLESHKFRPFTGLTCTRNPPLWYGSLWKRLKTNV